MAFVGLQLNSCSRATNLALTLLMSFVLLFNTCYSLNRKVGLNVSKTTTQTQYDSDWSPAGATWYGSATGGGSDGGSCGYASAVEQTPFSNMVTAVGPSLYQSGQGCGACYQVKCTDNAACSGTPVTVTVTDSCPGCTSESAHFDLSGTAFGAMAKSGQANQLRNAGILQIQYQRVECKYPGVTLTFHVDSGSNPYYFAAVIEYANGDGGLKAVELQQAGESGNWLSMNNLWGALWELNHGSKLQAPFSLRLTEAKSGKTLVLNNVIPEGWQPDQTYVSASNFEA